MRSLIVLILALSLVACGHKSEDAPPTAYVDPNAALEPSVATCSKIRANLTGDYFIDLKPMALFISGGHPYFMDSGNFTPFMSGNLPIDTFCTLVVLGGTVTGVL